MFITIAEKKAIFTIKLATIPLTQLFFSEIGYGYLLVSL